jgi:hypothetical protein
MLFQNGPSVVQNFGAVMAIGWTEPKLRAKSELSQSFCLPLKKQPGQL